MSDAVLIHLTTQLLWIVLLLSLPIVASIAVISLFVSLMQTLTQLQDQSLQFIFKLVVASLALFFSYRWMGLTLLNYSEIAFVQLSRVGP